MLTWAVNIYKSCVLRNATVLCIYLCSNLTTEQKFVGIVEEMFHEALPNLRKFISLLRTKKVKDTFLKTYDWLIRNFHAGWPVRKTCVLTCNIRKLPISMTGRK